MFISEINEVKDHLERLKSLGVIRNWELPYENILTRRSAAIFFLDPRDEASMEQVVSELERYENFRHRINSEKKLSDLEYRITFSGDEKVVGVR